MNGVIQGLLSLLCLFAGVMIIAVGTTTVIDFVGLIAIFAGLALLVNVVRKAIRRT